MSKKLIPFNLLPASWGLKGTTREIAQAEYELDGFELKVKILDILSSDDNATDYAKKLLDIKLKYSKITTSQYQRDIVSLISDDTQRALAELELDNRDGVIVGLAYEKKLATLKDEPWVNIVKMDFTKKTSLEGSFELDWNEQFVEKLNAEGYTGPTPDNVVNQWFMELCRNIAMEEFDGTGDFTADSEANLDAMKRWSSQSESFEKDRKGYM